MRPIEELPALVESSTNGNRGFSRYGNSSARGGFGGNNNRNAGGRSSKNVMFIDSLRSSILIVTSIF
jgi:hypothetical protein